MICLKAQEEEKKFLAEKTLKTAPKTFKLAEIVWK